MGKWSMVKAGFWLGIGFIIPQLVTTASETALTFVAMPVLMQSAMDTEEGRFVPDFSDEMDRTAMLSVSDVREVRNGEQLLILGMVENTGEKKASSIQLEAELLDEEGVFVYECSRYISKTLMPGDSENFQIKCGCDKEPVPEYASAEVRVVSATGF